MFKGGQNRIEYIVYHKPFEAAKLLEKHGYQVPKKAQDLAVAVKQLVKRKGEPAIKELIQFHPEKTLILEMTGHNSEESSYCGCNSSYTGELKDYLGKLPELSINELTELYEDAKKKAKDTPENNLLMLQVETVWDELKRRKKQAETEIMKEKNSSERFYLYMGLAFFAGIVIAKIA